MSITIIKDLGKIKYPKDYRRYYLVQCSCGVTKERREDRINTAKSCGCLTKETTIARTTTHGMANSRIYRIYRNMKTRCYNENNKGFSYYGGRGIVLSDSWKESRINFFNDMLPSYKENLILERIDNNKGYSKENCRWATWKEQANNTRHNVKVDFMGKSMNVSQWADELGISRNTMNSRMYKYRRGFMKIESVFKAEEFKKRVKALVGIN